MPFVDLVASEEDYASIWYTTNSPSGNVGSFDPERPTIMMLHPLFVDSSWLLNHFDDPRLIKGYNIIALDLRVCGRSKARPTSLHDCWMEAADLAFIHQALRLPPVHILAIEALSIYSSLRLALLFPEMCLSLTLCSVPPPSELPWVFGAYEELRQAWCFAEDLNSFQHTGFEAVRWVAGPDVDVDLQDELISWWETFMPPFKRVRTVEQMNAVMNRVPLKPKELAEIKQPVLVIQAECNELWPVKYAEQLAADLVNSSGGAVVYTIKGGTGSLSIKPSNASILNQVFSKFLSRLPRVKSHLNPPLTTVTERMKTALAKLAVIEGDQSIAERDPLSSLSFSCVTPDVCKSQLEALRLFAKDRDKAFSPLGPDGRSIRKFSERKQEHWFHGENDGSSYAGSSLAPGQQTRRGPPPSEPVSIEKHRGGRGRRAIISPNPSDKLAIKGSMAKVVASTGSFTLPNFFKSSSGEHLDSSG